MKYRLRTLGLVSLSLFWLTACAIGGGALPAEEKQKAEDFAQRLHSALKPKMEQAFGSDFTLTKTDVVGGDETTVTLTWALSANRPSGAKVETSITKLVESLGGTVTFSFGGSGGRGSPVQFQNRQDRGAVVDFDNITIDGITTSGSFAQPKEGAILTLSVGVPTAD